jgi:hypothetical protein
VAKTTHEYLWALLAIDPERGQVWLRQGDPDVLGMAASDLPMEFGRWNTVLNHLGGQGWDVVSTDVVENNSSTEQLWLFKREAEFAH